MKRHLVLVAITLFLSSLMGCGKNLSPNTYEAAEVGVAGKVIPGVIIGKRVVNITNNTGVGGAAGATAGGVGGSAIGGSTRGNIAGAIGGAVVGGVVGNAIEKGIGKQKGYEYIIKLNTGSTISITQTKDVEFAINQRVLVIYGAMTRIVPDESPVESKK